MTTKTLFFLTDFSLLLHFPQGFPEPFRFRFFAESPARYYDVTYDGFNTTNCRFLTFNDLLVTFDCHKLGLGILSLIETYYLNNSDFEDGIEHTVKKPHPLILTRLTPEGSEDYIIELSTEGATELEGSASINPPYIKGDKGEKGDKGDKGEKGDKGDKGDPGEDGGFLFPSIRFEATDGTLHIKGISQEVRRIRYNNTTGQIIISI